jgi:hypothetical protein
MMVKENENEAVWKEKNGNLTPISKLNDEQLIVFHKLALYKTKKFFDLYNLFENLRDQMDEEISKRAIEAENKAKKFKEAFDRE